MSRLLLALALGSLQAGVFGGEAAPQGGSDAPPAGHAGAMAAADVDERPGALLPLDLVFADEDGRPMALSELFRPERPVLLVLGWYRCRTLCGTLLDGVVEAAPAAEGGGGPPPPVVMVSIDPREGPRDARARRIRLREEGPGLPPGRLSLLTGSESAVRELADAVGYRYARDPETDQFAHPAAVVVLTPAGRVSGYLYGVRFERAALREALRFARAGESRASLERILLRCFRYVPALERHAGFLAGVLKGGAVLILLGLAGVFGVAARRASLTGPGGGSP